MSDAEAPIACTLDGPSYSTRLAEIRALTASALRRSERDGLRLHLTFDASARDAVEAMVQGAKLLRLPRLPTGRCQ